MIIRKFSGLVLVSILAFSLSSTTAFAANDKDKVVIKDIDKVAEKALKKLRFEEDIDNILTSQAVYGVDNQIVAYYFQFPEHFLLISASKKLSPILAAGGGEMKFLSIDSSSRLYYFGGLTGFKASESDIILEEIQRRDKSITYTKEQFK
ncbi:hypothetical protein M3223_20865 [Paenibacillus pasadenensis]|uniref:hypothetical protein n=1 Tax=Paenibacillus pasadenensis TaxID=217090 RepID=UPI00203ABCF2|nr:hypothetical protein [Paenibacillus pasadenensis]MCM3749791.1 hypothetical protein [Paenibacillus pasadenensis]